MYRIPSWFICHQEAQQAVNAPTVTLIDTHLTLALLPWLCLPAYWGCRVSGWLGA
jgi:hypothetical protein